MGASDQTVTFRGKDGGTVSFTIPDASLRPEERDALSKLVESKSVAALSPDDLALLQRKHITLGDEATSGGPIVRFDCKWVTWKDFDEDILQAVVEFE